MTRHPVPRLLPLAVLLCTTLVVSSSRAQSFYGAFEVGGLAAIPTHTGSVQFGFGGALSLGILLADDHLQLGGRVRTFLSTAQTCGPPPEGCDGVTVGAPGASAGVEVLGRFHLSPRVSLAVGVVAGAGFWMGCVVGDWCGGIGLNLAVDARLLFQVGERLGLHLALDPQVQFGMVNGVEALVMPTVWFGVDW